MALTPTEAPLLASLVDDYTKLKITWEELLARLLAISPEAASIAAAIATHNDDGSTHAQAIAAHNTAAGAHDFLFGAKCRRLLTSSVNYYLALDGSDSNDGLASNRPFKTWSRLLQALRSVDGGGNIGTVTFGAGTWTGNFVLTGGDVTGFRSLAFQGAGSGIDGTLVDSSSVTNHCCPKQTQRGYFA